MHLPPLTPGRLIRRYQRFLADVALEDGRSVTAHCANSGSMLGLLEPGAEVRLSQAPTGSGRKLAWTWELVRTLDSWVGIHTGRTNAIAEEGLRIGRVAGLAGFSELRREVPLNAHTRLDFLLTWPDGGRCFVEVKSVTLRLGEQAAFPDAVTARGKKHLEALEQVVAQGDRAALLFVVQREDCSVFTPARAIDPAYAAALEQAAKSGVEIKVQTCRVGPDGISLLYSIPFADPMP